jgi:hypothetical protein
MTHVQAQAVGVVVNKPIPFPPFKVKVQAIGTVTQKEVNNGC